MGKRYMVVPKMIVSELRDVAAAFEDITITREESIEWIEEILAALKRIDK